MRTVKASEVVKGMNIEAERKYDNGDRVCIAGVVKHQFTARQLDGDSVVIDTATYSINLPNDHPVTVLAEPEPEWVEGAWYWTLAASQTTPRIRKRMERGWGSVGVDGTSTVWLDNGAADFTVLGRVLIVDWPGHDVARVIEAAFEPTYEPSAEDNRALKAIADAIRTQGGVR